LAGSPCSPRWGWPAPSSSARRWPAPAGEDFNGDGFADLAIGVPDEDVGGALDAGAVVVLYGGPGVGLDGTASDRFREGFAGVPGASEAGARFGAAVAKGDFDADGFGDLAVGVPSDQPEAVGSEGSGSVNVLYGATAAGTSAILAPTGGQLFHQGTPGIDGDPEVGDAFGSALG
jgi:FG-GAP repeat